MSRRYAGSMLPNDEEMPYSDDETDDELDDGSESEAEERQEAPPPTEETARPPGDLIYLALFQIFKV